MELLRGDKTSDSLIDGLADKTRPCERHGAVHAWSSFQDSWKGSGTPTMQPEWGSPYEGKGVGLE